jgi:hypothetical protein
MACNAVQALDSIAAIQQAISVTFEDGTVQQVTHAYPYGEWTVTSNNLPFFVNEMQGGDTNFAATPGLQNVEDIVQMYLCLWPTAQGRSRETSLRYVLEWRDAVFAAFAAKMRLGGNMPFVKSAFIQHWDYGTSTIGATSYWALHFELSLGEAFTLAIGT